MDRSRAFQIRIVGDIADAKRSLKSIEGDVSKFSRVMSVAGKAFAAAFVVREAIQFGSAMVRRAEEMESAYAITNRVLEQTGGVVGRTADEIKTLNRQLSLRTGIDKKIITEGGNVLLTFKSIRDEVGEGNQIFTRANELALDMSTVFGTDVKSSATQLGKALEDPIAGLSSLRRVGVTFTDSQKAMIEELVESGNVLEAQRLILDALEGQVGGSAEASADATAKISNAWREVQEWLGSKILPLLDTLASWIWETAIPAFEQFAQWVTDAWNTITSVFKGGSSDQLDTAKGWLSEIVGYYQDFAKMVRAIIDRFVTWATWIWDNFGEQITAVVKVAWSNIKATVDLIIGVIRGLVQLVTAIFEGDWSAAWDAAKGIIESFWKFFKGLPGRMVDALRAAVGLVGAAAVNLGKAIVNGIIGFWNRLDPRITVGPMPGWLPGIGGKRWQSPDLLPDIPKLATGGIVSAPTLALIGEAGPEAVVPLSGRHAPAMGSTYNITVQAGVGDPTEIGRAVVTAITAYERSAGDGWRTAAAV